jgi:hypothetical protein
VSTVPTATRKIVFLNPRYRYLFVNTFWYASADGFLGISDNPITVDPPNEVEMRNKKGYTIVKHTKIIKIYSTK